MQILKQLQSATVIVGPILDSSGLAVTTAVIGDFTISKNGTSAQMAAPATSAHSHNGFYNITLSTGNTDTVGRLDISVNNANQSMGLHRYTVFLPSVYDALVTNDTNVSGGLNSVQIIDASVLQSVADNVLSRNVSNVESTAPEHSLATVILALLEMSMSGTTMTIKRTDGTTVHVTKTITLDANASPITGIN